ncbi:MAG: hypothetical protein PHC28_13500 [Flavobacterium sp.]|uniref:hypothetical protein n=1 Tax=Flavobacterium sp. TaxID=239 RepID=UPI00260C9EF6|nr:hypothetical protein [Flavobacterium sp.]MDD5151468.1 hypothetical protein [Flavobacterium sp.]
MNNIFNDIRRAVFEYEISTGLTPTRIYLGINEYAEIKSNFENFDWNKNDDNIEFLLGYKIYKVIDNNHHIRVCN